MTTGRAIALCWAMVIVASSTPTAAANSCDEPLCILMEASSLLDEDRPRQALEILKEARADFPDDGRLVRM
ncbi:MAG: hypothetical protein HN348_27685, partial [Proteobacteria bacterium]|nr:hypothetical protein [Pseudomonadota bacterium]